MIRPALSTGYVELVSLIARDELFNNDIAVSILVIQRILFLTNRCILVKRAELLFDDSTVIIDID